MVGGLLNLGCRHSESELKMSINHIISEGDWLYCFKGEIKCRGLREILFLGTNQMSRRIEWDSSAELSELKSRE